MTLFPERAESFQLQAISKLLSTLDIRKGFQKCLLYIREVIPADYFSLHLFDDGLGTFETVVDATPERSPMLSQKSILAPEAREAIRARIRSMPAVPSFAIIDSLKDDPTSRQLGLDLNTPDSSCLYLRLYGDGCFLGIAALTPKRADIRYNENHGKLLILLHDALAYCAAYYLGNEEIRRLQDALISKTCSSSTMKTNSDTLVGADGGLKSVVESCKQIAETQTPVLLLGETGVGKEVIAETIHKMSTRSSGPLLKVNCGGIPPTLLESQLFGHVKGSFTGAFQNSEGFFGRARGGTLFLDEIGELSLDAQTRFLRVLQDMTYERVGGKETLYADVNIIAATHRNLEAMVREQTFRKDLFFRLNIFPIKIPALRDRKDDIPELTHYFIKKISVKNGLPKLPQVAQGAIDNLYRYDWPGNVRELENVVEREIIIKRDRLLTFEGIHIGQDISYKEDSSMNLDTVISRHIVHALTLCKGKVEGPGGAAELLGINPRTLQSRMTKLKIPFGRKIKSYKS